MPITLNRITSRRMLAAVATFAATVSLLLTSCSSSHSKAPSSPGSSTGSSNAATGIVIKNFGYSGTLTVKAGEKVTVTNEDSVPHTVTDKATHRFDTGSISGSGGTMTFTAPSAPGTYKISCTFHQSMAGTLIVTG